MRGKLFLGSWGIEKEENESSVAMIGFAAALCFVLSRSCAGADLVESPYKAICDKYRSRNQDHTACRDFDSKWMPRYTFATANKVKEQALFYLNHYRGIVARGEYQAFPAASDMRVLEWDIDLEASAALHAHRLLNDSRNIHDRVEDRFTENFDLTGQTVGFKRHLNSGYGFYWHYAVRQWLTEAVRSTPSILRAYAPAAKTDNFTQLVWATTEYVGCYQTVTDQDAYAQNEGFFAVHVCNFGPAGNVPGRPVYRPGAPCSRCPNGSVCDPPSSLCTKTDHPPPWPTGDDDDDDDDGFVPPSSAARMWRAFFDFCVVQTSLIALLRIHN